MVEHNETPDHNTAEQAATEVTVLSDDDRPPSMAEQSSGSWRTIGNKISYNHLYNPYATSVPALNKTNFMSDSSIEYSFEYLSEGVIEGFVLVQMAQMSMKLGIRSFGDSVVDSVHE